ncbi:MAG: hypothetical protein P4L87_07840 [Formivibrio sp.]|nr:hypothetical protein [Formivibrio sp.]
MSALHIEAFPYKNIHLVAKPVLSTLSEEHQPWLCLNGALVDTLDDDVRALTKRWVHHWVWRGTDWEYTTPGYRHGPLLVPLNEALLDTYLATWAPMGMGPIVLGPANPDTLIAHLQNLRLISAADGNPAFFSLTALRQIEEMAEGLPAHRFSEVLGPIQGLIWQNGKGDTRQWLRADNPSSQTLAMRAENRFALDEAEEEALGQTSHWRFLRDAARQFTEQYPERIRPLGAEELARRLVMYAGEAVKLEMTNERDMRHFMRLRLIYPQRFFDRDEMLRATLGDLKSNARLRLSECELRLQHLTAQPS